MYSIYEQRILVGIISITATIILVGWIAINENARMEEFTERAQGRQIEQGAKLFEANCSSCHGPMGLGTSRAPALNNPHLFGYNFTGDIDTELATIEAQLETETDATRRQELQARQVALQAEKTVIQEGILYDWQDKVGANNPEATCADKDTEIDPIVGYSSAQACELGELGAQLLVLDTQIEELEGIDSAANLPIYIGGRDRELAPLLEDQIELQTKLDASQVVEPGPELTAEETVRLAELDATLIPDMEAEVTPLVTERDELQAKLDASQAAENPGPALTEEEASRLTELDTVVPARQAELTALTRERDTLQTKLEASQPAEPGPPLTAEESELLAQLEIDIPALEAELQPYRTLSDQRANLVAEQIRFRAVVDAHNEVVRIREELAPLETELAALGDPPAEGGDPNASQRETLTTQISDLRSQLDAADADRVTAYNELITNNDVLRYNPDEPSRLDQVEWAGTLYDFIEGTLIGGRPTSALGGTWPQPMPNWAQLTGASLRTDQLRNLIEFVLNWDREFTIEDLRAVDQFAKLTTESAGAAPGSIQSNNVTLISEGLTALREGTQEGGDGTPFVGDPALGQQMFENEFGCAGCHGATAGTGPAVVGMWTRVANDQDGRLTNTGFTDNPELYLIQSIAQPDAFVSPGFASGVMPDNFTTERMSYEDLAHILAYLQTHNE